MSDPWNLTPQQIAALTAVAKVGCDKCAAESMGLSSKTVSQHVMAAKRRMHVKTRLLAVLEWDRYNRTSA